MISQERGRVYLLCRRQRRPFDAISSPPPPPPHSPEHILYLGNTVVTPLSADSSTRFINLRQFRYYEKRKTMRMKD